MNVFILGHAIDNFLQEDSHKGVSIFVHWIQNFVRCMDGEIGCAWIDTVSETWRY